MNVKKLIPGALYRIKRSHVQDSVAILNQELFDYRTDYNVVERTRPGDDIVIYIKTSSADFQFFGFKYQFKVIYKDVVGWIWCQSLEKVETGESLGSP